MELYVNIPLPEDEDEKNEVADDQREESDVENTEDDSSSDEESDDDDDEDNNQAAVEVAQPLNGTATSNTQSAATEFEISDNDSDFVEEVDEAEKTDVIEVFKVSFIYII